MVLTRVLAIVLAVGCVAVCTGGTSAQVLHERFDAWPMETSINGTVVLAASLNDLSILKEAIRTPAEQSVVRIYASGEESTHGQIVALQQVFEPLSITLSIDRKNNAHKAALSTLTKDCDVLCWLSSSVTSDAEQRDVAECSELLNAFVRNKGVLILIGPVATLAGKLNATGSGQPIRGLDLIQDAVIVSDYVGSESQQVQLTSVLRDQPRTVGVGLSAESVLVLNARRIRMAGSGTATFLLPNGAHHAGKQQVLARPTSRRQSPAEYIVDWTQWRRESIERTLDVFPPTERQTPYVENGTLVIVGGGGMPDGLMDRIVELAGGPESARMVYVPCEEQAHISPNQSTISAWKRGGVKNATFIHTKDRNLANTDEAFLAPLKDATGLWFGGGRQWNFADSYYGTQAHQLMKDVLSRGGVIGGSSAGASIQAEYLARATPIENFDIMASGYERGGLGFLRGVAIDQHFSQRGRQKDMTQLVNRYPQLLGIGLDEATAIIVQKSKAEVIGRGKVYFYDRDQPVSAGGPDYVALPAGSAYDLAARSVLIDSTPTAPEETPNANE